MNIPDNLRYTKDHEWVRLEDDGIATIGITDFAQGELGDVVFIEVETEGEELDKEEAFGTIEAVKTVSDLFMPMAGEVVEFNAVLEANPEIVNQDPYGNGWLVKIKMTDAADLDELLDHNQYRELIEG